MPDKFQCPICRYLVTVNQTGRLTEHYTKGIATVCPGSGLRVTTPEPDLPRWRQSE